MRFFPSPTLLVMCIFPLFTNALPLSGLRDERQIAPRKAPYSVVPVDGGQPDGAAHPKTEIVTKDSTQTITEPQKTLPPVTETMLSTTVVTDTEKQTAIITTVTTTSTSLATQAPAQEVSPSITTTTTTTSIPITTQAPSEEVSPSTITTFATVTSVVSSADTVTFTFTPSLTPYDNGMWHTTYYESAEPSSSSETSSSSSVAQTPSPKVDADSSTFTDVPSNGTYALMGREMNKPRPSNTTSTRTKSAISMIAAVKTKPPMPILPTTSEVVNPTQIPSVDVSKHMVPGMNKRAR